MKTLVAYYSRKGSNAFLAQKISQRLDADVEAIRPRINAFATILLNLNPGIRNMKHPVGQYERVIMVGPVFMGRFIHPLRSFARRYRKEIKEMHFISCCGSTDQGRDEKFGHGLVFKKAEALMGAKLTQCVAFPVGLILPEEQREDQDAFMKAHLSEATFKGEIAERFEAYMAVC